MPELFKKCSSCKKDIFTGQTYYVCSVSTCRGRVTNYAFCSVSCWDAHLPIERHKGDSAGAIEKIAPKPGVETEGQPRRIVPSSAGGSSSSGEDDLLVVLTKVRKYIADRSGMNTSAGVYTVLTERIKRVCDLAIESARAHGRKTVMDRDVP